MENREAIGLIRQMIKDNEEDGGVEFGNKDKEALTLAISALEQERWIPVTERLPEEREWIGTKHFGTTISDEVYVTFEAQSGERFARHMMFQNGRLSGYDQRVVDTVFKGAKPIAWRPHPEPYKEDL